MYQKERENKTTRVLEENMGKLLYNLGVTQNIQAIKSDNTTM